ncbi:MAG TPA: hypothetical protein VKQ29_15240 [Aliidongia sp.]|nr:hypothetical protein [Aliidongia sp.]
MQASISGSGSMSDTDKAGAAEDTLAAVRALAQPLNRAPVAKFRAAAKLLEEMRHRPGVQQVLDQVRPRLVKLRPIRKPNLQRLFYRPLEDLLIPDTAPIDQGLLPRRLAALAWRHVVGTGDAATRQALEQALRGIAIDDLAREREIARRLWAWAAGVLTALVTDPAACATLLGADAGLQPELIQIVALIHVADAIETLKEALPPRPIDALDDEQIGLIRRSLTRHAAHDAERSHALILAMMVRVTKRADFLEHLMGMTLALSAADKQAVHLRLSRLIMAEVGDRIRQLGAAARFDLVGLADGARHLVAGMVAAEKAFWNDPQAKRQLSDARRSAETAVTQVVGQAKGAVSAAIEIGPDAPVAALVDAENSILALRKCQTFADQIGLQPAVSGALGGIIGEVRLRAERLFAALGARTGTAPGRGEAILEMYWAVRMIELASNPEDADRLRRQGLAALG